MATTADTSAGRFTHNEGITVFPLHVLGLMYRPQQTWQAISQRQHTIPGVLAHILIMALIPALCWGWGVTQVGWKMGAGEATRITVESTLVMVVLGYLGILAALIVIGLLIHWMSSTYGAHSTPARAIALTAYTATPLFLGGLLGLYPLLWFDLLVGTAAVCYAAYLLYTGIPHMMGVPPERGYLFASAAVAAVLVIFNGMMGATVLLWEFGAMPVFTD